jgi:hypothetical protein
VEKTLTKRRSFATKPPRRQGKATLRVKGKNHQLLSFTQQSDVLGVFVPWWLEMSLAVIVNHFATFPSNP